MDIICRGCGHPNVSTLVRCEYCKDILKDDSTLTIQGLKQIQTLAASKQLSLPDAPSETALPLILIAKNENDRRSLMLQPGARRYLVGRRDDTYSNVDIDLSPLNGQQSGVSRRHAVLYLSGENWIIKDLESSNGTFLNGKRLEPLQDYLLSAEDFVSFGRLLLAVKLAETTSLSF